MSDGAWRAAMWLAVSGSVFGLGVAIVGLTDHVVAGLFQSAAGLIGMVGYARSLARAVSRGR